MARHENCVYEVKVDGFYEKIFIPWQECQMYRRRNARYKMSEGVEIDYSRCVKLAVPSSRCARLSRLGRRSAFPRNEQRQTSRTLVEFFSLAYFFVYAAPRALENGCYYLTNTKYDIVIDPPRKRIKRSRCIQHRLSLFYKKWRENNSLN